MGRADRIKVNIIEAQHDEMFPKMMQEHRGGTGAYDVLNIVPAWMGDMVRAGAVEPLDDYVDKYGYRAELDDIGDVYRENQMRIGDTIYGFPDDGDVFILYYRKDIFEEMGLSVPTTWDEFYEVSKAITDAKAPDVYGSAFMRARGLLQYFYQERARVEGCKFFDAETMNATINGPGCVKALAGMVKDNTTMPPGIEAWGFVETLAAFNAGQSAMLQSKRPTAPCRCTAASATRGTVRSNTSTGTTGAIASPRAPKRSRCDGSRATSSGSCPSERPRA